MKRNREGHSIVYDLKNWKIFAIAGKNLLKYFWLWNKPTEGKVKFIDEFQMNPKTKFYEKDVA